MPTAPLCPEQRKNGGLVMVNFYNDYVACKGQANLSQVAGRWVPVSASEREGTSGRTHTCRLPCRPPGPHQESGRGWSSGLWGGL